LSIGYYLKAQIHNILLAGCSPRGA